jgi:predicted amidophosphoribosyltransferase
MRQVSAVHYEDLYPKSFIAFRKKYLPLLKKGVEHRRYYVQFTNFMDDTLSKKPYENPDHHDPVAIYGYPLEYVLKHPADIWYGNQAKYLRVLTERKSSNTLLLQHMTESEANNVLYKMGLPYDSMDKAKALWPDRVGKGTGSIGRAFFQAMQMDMSGIGKIPRGKDERKAMADGCKVRSGKEQTALLRKAGFDAIEDTARNQKTAVINPREPEQIAFLHRNAFDVVEVIPLKLSQQKEGVGTSQNPSYLAPKLAAMVATGIGDRIVDRDENGYTFWTAGGREITVSFDRPSSYYEGKKIGEKKHKESKLHSPYLVKVSLASERGTFSPMAMASEKFAEIAADVTYRFNQAEPVEGFKPISKASRKAEKEAATKTYRQKEKEKKYEDLKRWVPDYISEIAEVAQRLGLPFTQAEFFNSSDEARELLDGMLTVVGRYLSNETYRAKSRLQEEDPKAWDWYSKYDREKAVKEAKEAIEYVTEDVDVNPALIKEMADIYEASLNWMLDNKTWSYQNPTGFFGWLLRDMKESEPAVVEVAAKLLADAAELLESIPVYSAMEYISTSKRPTVPMASDKARRMVLAMKEGNQQAANVIAKWLVRKHPKLLNFKGVIAPAARSTKERKPHMHFASALLNLGVGSKVIALFDRTKDLPSSRARRQAGLPGTTMEEHLESLAVTAPPESGGVLIVDDVITSGAMLKASVRALKRAGFKGPFLAATAATTVEEPRAALSPEESSLQAATVSGYLVNDVVRLKDYLLMDDAGKGYEIAWNAWPMFVGWAEDKQPDGVDVDGLNADDKDAAETNIDSIPQAVFAAFWDWSQRHGDLSKYVPPSEQPTFLFMEFERIVKGEWLVHFSNNAGSIAVNGFKHGIDDITTLGLTTHFPTKPYPGFNFAYLADDAARYGRSGRVGKWKYGDHAVMFKANGVKVYHYTDEEPQVIFLGSTAKDIVELENTDDGWVVSDGYGPIFRSGGSGIQRCIDWVKTNYDQYRNKLNQQAKAPAQKRKLAASTR